MLQTVGHHGIVDDEWLAFGGGVGNEVDDVEQLAGVAAGVAEEGSRLAHVDLAFLQLFVALQGPVEKLLQVGDVERFEHIDLTAGEERAYDFERRVFGRGTDEGHRAVFYGAQQRVLLRLVEAVYFIDKQDGAALPENAVAFAFFDDFAHLFYP